MLSFIYFLAAAVLLGAALFGSDVVRTFITKPDNVILVQIFIAILGVVLGVLGLFNNQKKRQEAQMVQNQKLTIQSGVHIEGEGGHSTTIANQVESEPKKH